MAFQASEDEATTMEIQYEGAGAVPWIIESGRDFPSPMEMSVVLPIWISSFVNGLLSILFRRLPMSMSLKLGMFISEIIFKSFTTSGLRASSIWTIIPPPLKKSLDGVV